MTVGSAACAGLAQRIGVDALLVRGAALVAALFGLPALLFYGLAWMLVPDPNGRILLRDLLHARLRPGVIGALITVLVGLFPWPLLVLLTLTARSSGLLSERHRTHDRRRHRPHRRRDRAAFPLPDRAGSPPHFGRFLWSCAHGFRARSVHVTRRPHGFGFRLDGG